MSLVLQPLVRDEGQNRHITAIKLCVQESWSSLYPEPLSYEGTHTYVSLMSYICICSFAMKLMAYSMYKSLCHEPDYMQCIHIPLL